MSLHVTQLNYLNRYPETALKLPAQQLYNDGPLYKNPWGSNWEYPYRQDNRYLHRFPIPCPPLPPHMASQQRKPAVLPNEYLDHNVVSRLPISPTLFEPVYEPEPEPRLSKWVYFWHSFFAVVPIWAFKKGWNYVCSWVFEGLRTPVGVAMWVWQSINWYAVFWLMVSFQVVKVVVPGFEEVDEVVEHTSMPLYAPFIPKEEWSRTGHAIWN